MPDVTVTTYEGSVAAENLGYTVRVTDGVALPPGGTTGQRLAKASDANYDYEWVTGGGGGSTVTVDADGTVTVDETSVELATDAQLSAHEADTTNVHGIADTSLLETTTAAQAKADAAEAAAEATAAAALAAHVAAADPHPGYLTTAEGNAAYEAAGAVAAHASDTTSVHGIADTADLILEGDSRLTDSRSPSGAAGGVLAGTYPNPSFAADMATQAELDAEAALARNADNLTSGTVADARIASTIARDSEVTAAISASEAGQVRDGDAAGGVLSGTYPNPGFAADMATQAELDAHVNDTSAAHAASAISYAGSAGLSATDVEAALDELDSEKAASGHTHTLDGLSDVDTTGVSDGDALVYDSGSWVPGAGGGGGGSVATDAIWDAKGDLAVGTGANTAAKLPAGADTRVLVLDSTTSTGLKWSTPAYYPLDIPPASSHAKDDEFTSTSLDGKWTSPLTSNAGNGVTNTLYGGGGWVGVESSTTGTGSISRRVVGIRQVAPTGSFTLTARLQDATVGGDQRGGIFVGIAGGQAHVWGPFSQDGQIGVIGVGSASETADWSAYDGFLTTIPTVTRSFMPTWCRIRWDSGASTLYFDYSQDGVIWRAGTSRSGQSQPNRIGLAIYSNGGTVQADSVLLCDWFRVTEP